MQTGAEIEAGTVKSGEPGDKTRFRLPLTLSTTSPFRITPAGVNGSVGATVRLSLPRFLPSSWRTLTDAMNHALGYIRVSSEEQADSGLGLEVLRQRIAAYCALKELHLAEVFEDPGISGCKPLASRPSGHKLLAAPR